MIGGSRVRGNHTDISDIDVGYGNLSIRNTQRTNKQITDDSKNIEGVLNLEQTRICPGNCIPSIPEIKSPEEFFQRSGIRSDKDIKAGQPCEPSGSISVYPDGEIVIIPPGSDIKILNIKE